MRVVHLVSTYPPYQGGMGRVSYDQVEWLKGQGIDAGVLTPSRWRFGNAGFISELERGLRDAQIVHLHYPFFGADWQVLKWKKKHSEIPLVVSYHMDAVGTGLKKIFFSWYRRRWFLPVLQVAKKIIVSSMDYATESFLQPIIKSTPEKIIEIPFGVDSNKFSPNGAAADLRDRFNIPAGAVLALFVGGLDPAHYFKGVSILIEAVAKIAAANPASAPYLLIVGSGSLKSAYESLADRLKILDRVFFLTNINDNELPAVYRAADVCVLPSIDRSESFGLVLLEAMASGKPVIASVLPGVRTVFTDKEGVAVNPGSVAALSGALQALTRQSARVLGERARERAISFYDRAVVGQKLLHLYQSVLK
ncbi:MAG: Glycosyltransferase [Candidatus Magasanikbacteria bacterium]|nr:Glycosyltransferase [Candidatus Magasanikbacteria bacterium]